MLETTVPTPEGMTQTRGESHGNQDKFRLTVDLEQCIYHYFDAPKKPKGLWGLTSVTFTGAHFNAQNADEHRRYIWDEAAPPHLRLFCFCLPICLNNVKSVAFLKKTVAFQRKP